MRTHRNGRPFLAPAVEAEVRKPFNGGQGYCAGQVVACPKCQYRIRLNIFGDIPKHRPGGGMVMIKRNDVECHGVGVHFTNF